MGTVKNASRPPLYRNRHDRVLLGVCAGIADHLGMQHVVVRLLTIGGCFVLTPLVMLLYLIAGCTLRVASADQQNQTTAHEAAGSASNKPSRTAADLLRQFDRLEERLEAAERKVTSREYRLAREIDALRNS
ncbi:MAG: PspC domain-containing protein [Geminicoccaceae bacterium]